METVTKMAWNPDTEEEYEIELPAESFVENALLELDYPPDGLDRDETSELLAQHFSLTDEQRNARYRSPNRVFNSYVGKVTGALVKSGEMVWLKDRKRGLNPKQVNEQTRVAEQDSDDGGNTTEESIETNYQQTRKELATELLQKIKDNTPTFFEKLVIDLLVKIGYGGSREDAGKAVGGSGDGGIDGIINEDRS